MSSDSEDAPQEIIIIKKNYGGDGGHHGGAWKIAYADFMTAMMALFLVLWLVNASDEETKVHLASYFNPVKLRDTITGPKGVKELVSGESAGESTEDKPEKAPEKKEAVSPQKEGTLLRDPYEALDELAEEAKQAQAGRNGGSAAELGFAESTEDIFQDSFEPTFWKSSSESDEAQQANDVATVEEMFARVGRVDDEAAKEEVAEAKKSEEEKIVTEGALVRTSAVSNDDASQIPDKMTTEENEKKSQDRSTTHDKGDQDKLNAQHEKAVRDANAIIEAAKLEAEQDEKRDAKLKALKRDIESALTDADQNSPEIEVEKTGEGLIVRLTDNIDFEMFAIASTEPRPDMVLFMEKIAKVLSSRPGQLVIMGHTDGRPFKSGKDNNWRLSAGRAQIAYHMLVRGGLDEKRFARIEGHADRNLKVPDDPESSKNRRIEILLMEPTT